MGCFEPSVPLPSFTGSSDMALSLSSHLSRFYSDFYISSQGFERGVVEWGKKETLILLLSSRGLGRKDTYLLPQWIKNTL